MKLLKAILLVSILFTILIPFTIYCDSLQARFIRGIALGYDDKIRIDDDFIVIPIKATNPVVTHRNINITIYGNVSTDGVNVYINVGNRRVNITLDKFIDLMDKVVKQNFSLEREFRNKTGEKIVEFYEDRMILRNRLRVRAHILGIFAINTTLEEEIILYLDGRVQSRIKRPFWWFLVTNVS